MNSVLEVDSAQLGAWITGLLWPLVRILALVSTAPVTGEAAVPRRARVLLALLLALLVSPGLPPMPQVPLVSVGGLLILAQQLIIGVAMGFAMRLVFAAVQAAGEYLGLSMGLSFAAFYDPTAGGNTVVLGRLLHALLVLVFLAMDGHLLMLQAIVHSLHTLPISDAPLASGGFRLLTLAGAQVFASGLQLALPLATAMLALNLCMGVLNRSAPQLSIFSIGFPLTLLVGMGLLVMMLPQVAGWMQGLVEMGLGVMQAMATAL